MKYIIQLFFLLAALFLSRCSKPTINTYQIGVIKIDVKNQNSKLISINGIDSRGWLLILNNKDTLNIEYGEKGIINNLGEDLPVVFPLKRKESIEKLNGRKIENENLYWSNEDQYDSNYGLFLKNYYMYDTINNIVVKIIQPKKVSNGTIGIYIPHLKDGNSLSMYGENLNAKAQAQAIEILRSIKYAN